jgi:NitT/TauT family transport system substrate-binding protein
MRLSHIVHSSLFLIVVVMALSCVPNDPGQEVKEPTLASKEGLHHIDLGVGYIPNVQFAPYYVAQAKGFYADEGLEVSLEYGFENDFVALTGQGERQFAVASGDQVILARAQGLPIVYVMTWYERYPVGVVALAESGIKSPVDLEGRKVGIPGLYGASYAGWKALVYAAGLDEDRVQLESIGFTQVEAVSQGQVDAAVVYLANEPIQLRYSDYDVAVIEVSDHIRLVSNGIVTSERLIKEDPSLIEGVVRASLRGLTYAKEHPDEAFEIARKNVPDMSDDAAPIQRMVLEASLAQWAMDGTSSAESWNLTLEAMQGTGLVDADLAVDEMYTNEFVK